MTLPEEILIISPVIVKKYSQVNGDVDENIITPSIYLAQDRYVQPYLGDALMEKIKEDIDADTLTGNYQILVEQYIFKPLAWWVMVDVIPKLTYKYLNGTLGQYTSEDVSPISDSQMKDEIARAKSTAEYYTQRLVDYLCANSSLFPEYSSNTGAQRCPRTKVTNSTTILFSNTRDAGPMRETRLNRYLP